MDLITENVSFGMTVFQREHVKDDLTRLFAALSATNEAIMRAKTRPELFNQVCEAAVLGGSFTLTSIALARPGLEDVFVRIVAETNRADAERLARAEVQGSGATAG